MTKDEALKLALEALENAIAVRHGKDGTKFVDPLESNAITAIKEALAQPAQEPPSEWALIKNILDEYGLQAISFVADWKAAQPEQEPRNFCSRCGKRAQGVLGQPQVHTCTPPLWGHQ